MKRTSIVLLVVMLFVASLAFAGCSKDDQASAENEGVNDAEQAVGEVEEQDDKIVLGLSILTREHVFWNTVAEAVEDKCAELGIELIVVDAQQDSEIQYGQIQDFIIQGVDGIIMSPAATAGSKAAMKLTEEAGIPVVTLFLKSDGDPVAHVGTNEIMGGNLAGTYAAEVLGGQGQCAIITYDEIEQCVDRAEGFKAIVDEYPDMEVVAESNYSGDTDKAASATQDFITMYPDLKLIFAVGDPAAVGAINTIKSAGEDIIVIGYDGNPEAIEAIKGDDSLWIADIAQDPAGAGVGSVIIMLAYLNGDDYDEEHLIDPYVIDMQYIEENGL